MTGQNGSIPNGAGLFFRNPFDSAAVASMQQRAVIPVAQTEINGGTPLNKRNFLRVFIASVMAFALLASVLSVAWSQGSRRRGGRGDRRDLGGSQPPNGLIGTALPQSIDAPPDNPTTPAKVALGKLLFWDPVLSGDKDVACATCHYPSFGYAENRDISVGVSGVGLGNARTLQSSSELIPLVKRNSLTILNTAFNGIDQQGHYNPSSAPMFWDNRAKSLEAQALVPIQTLEEMRGTAFSEKQALTSVTTRLQAIPEYRALFAKAFGGAQPITSNNVGRALAAFERSLLANNSPFDRYMRGDAKAMASAEVQGMREFQRVGCVNCHNGPMFSDYKLHVLSVPDNPKLPASDSGANQTYAFRTASLRNLAFTAPYMHSGAFTNLADVLKFYNRVRRRPSNPNVSRDQIDPLLLRLRGVDDSSRDIIKFLSTLNDDSFDKTIPTHVPSGLHPGGRIDRSTSAVGMELSKS
jgi:cytochrome c peroxidase